MLGARHTSRVTWRRLPAPRHYVGYVAVGDYEVRFAGHDEVTGIDVTLSIPFSSIREVRVSGPDDVTDDGDHEQSVVVELVEDEPIHVRPLRHRPGDLASLAQQLREPAYT